jgi:lysine-specific demethylase 3
MPAHVVSHQVARLKKDTMDEDAFLAVWALGQPLVVEGVTPAEVWDPAKFIAMHGSEQCMIVRCDKDGGEKIVTVAKFFETFGLPPDEKQELLGSGIWKLKVSSCAAPLLAALADTLSCQDWPPSAEFAQAFPLLNADFNRSVPMPDFTRRDGRKNIAALFPTNGNAPDLGPKMYNAWPGQLSKWRVRSSCFIMQR